MGAVYLAARESDGAHMAVKVIVPDMAGRQQLVERFLREARILGQLQHPHIVAFHEMGEANGQLFFSMDYVQGSDAAGLLHSQGPLPVRSAVRIACQALSALDYAHGRGFVHRDVKPANLLLAEEAGRKTVKVADFGLARVYQQSQLSGLTLQGDVGGTPAFMPPEHITHFREARPAADQYATAATLYNLLTDRYLFDFKGPASSAISMILEEEPVPIRSRRADLPDGLAAAIHRALAKEPEARFASVQAFRKALMPFAT
jgi:serine/threonine-protein kinase